MGGGGSASRLQVDEGRKVLVAEIRGKVASVARGGPLARAQVALLAAQREAATINGSSFVVQGLTCRHYTLRLNAAGYPPISVEFSLAAGYRQERDAGWREAHRAGTRWFTLELRQVAIVVHSKRPPIEAVPAY